MYIGHSVDLNWNLERKPCGELLVLGSGSYGKVHLCTIDMVALGVFSLRENLLLYILLGLQRLLQK